MADSGMVYRLYDADQSLLYVGLTGRGWPQRMREHLRDKPWFSSVTAVNLTKYPTLAQAADAEAKAIRSENPRHNIMHNRNRKPRGSLCPCESRETYGQNQWVVVSRRRPHERKSRLWLVPELSCDPVVDDVFDASGEDQLEYWLRYLLKHREEELLSDKVPISWFVAGDKGIFEAAPFAVKHYGGGDFLDHFYVPHCSCFDHDDVLLDFYKLPVVMSRWPALYEALEWRPSPLQPFIPLHSLIRSSGRYYW